MKRILSGLLFLLPLLCWAQTTSKPKDLNAVFDNVIRKDTTLKIVRTTIFPQRESASKAPKVLSYPTKYKLYDSNLKSILDDTSYSETDKIAFIKNALADTSQDAFEYINGRSILFWRSSKEATQLIEQYFASKAFEHANYIYTKYKHFEWVTNNLFPQAYDSTIQYFNKRDTLTQKYPHEGRLVNVLLKLGKEKEALHYLEILINDCLKGKIEPYALEIKAFPLFTETDPDENVFSHFCFSNDPEIVEKATNLLFQLLEAYDYETSSLYPLTTFLNKGRLLKLLSKRFEHYVKVDFSKLDSTKLTKEDRSLYYQVVPEGNRFFSFMYSNSLLLGEVKGRAMWRKFVETMPYWDLYGQSFEMSQMYILENTFRDTSLTQQEMSTILMQCKITEQFYTEANFYGTYKARFLRLLCKAYPNKKVPKEDFNKLQLSKILKYSYPLQITSYDLELVPYKNTLTPTEADSLVHIVNTFAKSVKLTGLELTKKGYFALTRQSAIDCIFNFFTKNNRMVAFDAEGASVPANYIELFEKEFEPILRKAGINNIEISQTTTRLDKHLFHYKIYVKCGDVTYMHELKEESTDWYNQQRLSKLINLCLMQNKSVLRLVEVNSGDQSAYIILCEPRKLKPFLTKYGLASWAITTYDDFHNAGN